MSDDLKLQESVKKTQELLNKYIKKPPLTDKLLKKPPFRFLHDIINAIIKERGFLKDLFDDYESNSSNIKDKEAKLAYLNKLIDTVKLITGNELSARPSKIISGQEPIKTNELLQAIGRALDKNVSSAEAIDYYKKNLDRKENLKSKSVKLNASIDEKAKKSVKKSSPSESKSSSREKIREKDDKLKRESKSSLKESSSSKIRESSSEKRDSKTKITAKTTRETKRKEITNDPSKKRKSQISNEKRTGAVVNERINNTTSQSLKNDTKKIEIIEPETSTIEISKVSKVDNEISNEQSPLYNQENNDEIIPDNNNDVLDDEIILQKQLDDKDEKNNEKSIDIVTTKSNVGLLRPPSVRPSSARPAAPKIRIKPDFIINNVGTNQMGDVNVIIENTHAKYDDNDDGDDMVVMETAIHNDSISIDGSVDLLNAQLTQEHGYLVAQILETQRELVNESNVELIPNKVEIEWEAGVKKDRDVIVKEIDKLRGTIQSLTRTTNPLGKLLNFIQEDAEIMEKELEDWRKEFINVKEQLIIERNMTAVSLKPLEESLKEIENTIVSEMEKIFQTKANIMKNNQKIQRLLSGK